MRKGNIAMKVWTLFFMLVLPVTGYAAEAQVFVKHVEGDVSLSRAKITGSIAGGAQLQQGDVIKTGKDGLVDIVWDNRWGYRLLGKSDCALKSLDSQHSVIEMKDGDIIFNIEALPKDGQLDLETPIAVAAVRGTQFWGNVDGRDATFAVKDGYIDITVKKSQDTFRVREGQAFDIKKGDKFTLPRPAFEVEMKALKQADEIIVMDSTLAIEQ